MSRHYHACEVFLFDENTVPLGRICHRKECPTNSVDCFAAGCGKPKHLRVFPDFEYDEKTFLLSPIEILWTTFKKSCLLEQKEKLGIAETRKYPVLEDIEIKCIPCGKTFTFTAEQQKWYQKRRLHQPKRCPNCKEKKLREMYGDL